MQKVPPGPTLSWPQAQHQRGIFDTTSLLGRYNVPEERPEKPHGLVIRGWDFPRQLCARRADAKLVPREVGCRN